MSPRTNAIVIGVLAVALVALAAFTIAKTSSLNSKISDVEDTTSKLEASTSQLEASTATGGKDVAGEIEAVSLSLKKLRTCLPEIQNEINGLSVEIEVNFAYIENNSQVSSYCQPLVDGLPLGGGE